MYGLSPEGKSGATFLPSKVQLYNLFCSSQGSNKCHHHLHPQDKPKLLSKIWSRPKVDHNNSHTMLLFCVVALGRVPGWFLVHLTFDRWIKTVISRPSAISSYKYKDEKQRILFTGPKEKIGTHPSNPAQLVHGAGNDVSWILSVVHAFFREIPNILSYQHLCNTNKE